MGGMIDVEADDIRELLGELRVRRYENIEVSPI